MRFKKWKWEWRLKNCLFSAWWSWIRQWKLWKKDNGCILREMEQAKDTPSFKVWASWQHLMNGCLRRYSVFLQGMPDLFQLRSKRLLVSGGLCFTSFLSTNVHLSRKSKADVRPTAFCEFPLSPSSLSCKLEVNWTVPAICFQQQLQHWIWHGGTTNTWFATQTAARNEWGGWVI